MGSWGSKPFENDVALDLWSGLRRGGDMVPLSRTLQNALDRPDSYFDVTDAEAVLAAGELIAAGLGLKGADLPEGASEWAIQHRNELSADILQLARLALRRVRSHASLLMESWFSPEDAEVWLETVEDLSGRLEHARPASGS